MPPLQTHFEVVVGHTDENHANITALIMSSMGYVGVEVREVAE